MQMRAPTGNFHIKTLLLKTASPIRSARTRLVHTQKFEGMGVVSFPVFNPYASVFHLLSGRYV